MRAARRLAASLALALMPGLALGVVGPDAAAAARRVAPRVEGAIEVVRGSEPTRVIGWMASPVSSPVLVIVVDNRVVRRFRPGVERHDVRAAIRVPGHVVGFDVRVGRPIRESLCLAVEVDGVWHGIDCWYRDISTVVAALGAGPEYGTRGRLVTYSVEVEGATGLHPEDVARAVDRVLSDRRSWIGDRRWRFARVRPDRAAVRILVATPASVDASCAPLATAGRLSCQRGDQVFLNADRWLGAVPHWTAGLDEYRAYLVNHEVGHWLGFGHVGCPGPGRPAPVMLQQSRFLLGCEPNGWPNP